MYGFRSFSNKEPISFNIILNYNGPQIRQFEDYYKTKSSSIEKFLNCEVP